MNDVDKIKAKIAKSGLPFYTHQVIDNSGYVDFYFTGFHEGKEVVWNTTLTTARGDYLDKVGSIAADESYDEYPIPDHAFDNIFEKIPGTNCSRMIDKHPELTKNRMKFREQRTMDLLDSKTVSIDPWTIEIDDTYEYGVGLHARMDVKSFDVETVISFMLMFKSYGATAFEYMPHTPMSLTSDELGVTLYKDKMVIWKDGFRHNDVAIKPGIFDYEDEE